MARAEIQWPPHNENEHDVIVIGSGIGGTLCRGSARQARTQGRSVRTTLSARWILHFMGTTRPPPPFNARYKGTLDLRFRRGRA